MRDNHRRKTWLKLLGVTLQDNPCNWDLHFEEMLKKASGRMASGHYKSSQILWTIN
jgi:hypothetical protein